MKKNKTVECQFSGSFKVKKKNELKVCFLGLKKGTHKKTRPKPCLTYK